MSSGRAPVAGRGHPWRRAAWAAGAAGAGASPPAVAFPTRRAATALQSADSPLAG